MHAKRACLLERKRLAVDLSVADPIQPNALSGISLALHAGLEVGGCMSM
jgi:hypothetical protein